ncbi:hypothetical protein GYMLUDRAFT_728282 [Collybiopsis luxurians FD-317 M1]|nr:hypothetical protein GYMLUDRAFT_728282 [Collybiopsis luxurians FD-317 M1]
MSSSRMSRHRKRPQLKPAMRLMEVTSSEYELPLYSRIRWTFGRGSVIRTIWKSVLVHTLFAIVVVTLTLTTNFNLEIPNVMLTLLGVALGFVISYRAASGYDRYWMGRTAFSDVIRVSHTMARLIHYHVPPCRTPRTEEERKSGEWKRPEQELQQVMTEKQMALDLVEGFSVALKHHLRGEPGVFYEDLYDLVRPLQPNSDCPSASFSTIENLSTSSAAVPMAGEQTLPNESEISTFKVPMMTVTGPSFLTPRHVLEHEVGQGSDIDADYGVDGLDADHRAPWKAVPLAPVGNRSKYRPVVAGEGDNLSLEILRCLSEWCSVLEDRGTIPGTSLGSMMDCICTLEDNLTILEKILTVPLPYVFSVHIRHTVWLFLLFLPFQLVGMFGWHSIAGVLIASFIYLGFLAAGEEIEQPFGYDENDLDLDLFCHAIIHISIQQLRHARCLNAYFPQKSKVKAKQKQEHRSMTVTESTTAHDVPLKHDP